MNREIKKGKENNAESLLLGPPGFQKLEMDPKILYLIYMEPVLVKLGQILHGVNLGTFDEIDNDYCDDVEILVEDENDLIRAEEIFTKFESFSGARLNRSHKSKIMGIGSSVGKQNWPLPWLKVEKSLYIFGILIFPTFQEILKSN